MLMHSWDYWDSFGKLRKGLPSKDKFYSLINHADSDKTMNILLTFGKVLIKDYHDLNLKAMFYYWLVCPRLLEKKLIKSFEIEPAHYLSTPGNTWDAMLKFTDVNVKLISDVEKYQFVESVIRSAISMICKGYVKLTINC